MLVKVVTRGYDGIPGVELRMDADIPLYMGSGCFLLTIGYWGVMVIDYEKFNP